MPRHRMWSWDPAWKLPILVVYRLGRSRFVSGSCRLASFSTPRVTGGCFATELQLLSYISISKQLDESCTCCEVAVRYFIVGPRSTHSSQSGSQPNGAQPEHPGADHPVTALQTDGYPFGVADSPSTLHRYQTYSTAHANTAAGRKLRPYLRRAQNAYRVLRARLPFHHRPNLTPPNVSSISALSSQRWHAGSNTKTGLLQHCKSSPLAEQATIASMPRR